MKANVITMAVDVLDIDTAVSNIFTWALSRQSRYVCVSNVHMCIETYNDADFQSVVNSADLVVADGRPISWAQKLLGYKSAQQVRGMDLTLALCQKAEVDNLKIGFYGGQPETLKKLEKTLLQEYPNLEIAISIAPPFRILSEEEKAHDIQRINDSGVQVLFIGLGCPKQEKWMQEHKEKVQSVMLGVGAAFDFIAGDKSIAPGWMQKSGLEWLHRLVDEPSRLWRRYLYTNPKFIVLFLRQLVKVHFF